MRQRQRARLDLPRHAPVYQRFLAAVRHPHLARRQFLDGGCQFVPVGMVGHDQRQLDIALPRALPDAYSSARHRRYRVGQAARPAVLSACNSGDGILD